MRTSKPISTISYNSDDFLKQKIEQWKSAGIIEYGMWIKHQPEEDEKKAHFHVFLKPAQLLQTTFLEDDSIEIDPLNPEKPFKMISFRVSKESDWILYSIHDKAYLQEKGLTRDIHYDIADIISTCEDTLTDILSHLNDDRKGRLETKILDCVNKGMGWNQIVSSGLIPIRQISGARLFYSALTGQDNVI